MADDTERRRRAETRRLRMTGRVTTLAAAGTPPAADSASKRLGAIWPLTVDAWALAGREIPTYRRAEMPGRVIRPGDHE